MSVKKQDLISFLLASNRAGYAGGEEKKWVKETDGSTTIPFVLDEWKSHDNFFGGEPYGGRTIVFYQDKPVWIMVYYGWGEKEANPDAVYAMLRKALKRMPEDAPFRGPKRLEDGALSYTNFWDGDGVTRFRGQEQIVQAKTRLYSASYMGVLVDVRSGV